MKRRKSWWKEAPVAEEEAREEGIWSDGQNRYHADPGGRDGPSTHFFRAFGGGGLPCYDGIKFSKIYFFKGTHCLHQQFSLEYKSMHPCFHCRVDSIPCNQTSKQQGRRERFGSFVFSTFLAGGASSSSFARERRDTRSEGLMRETA